MVAGTQVRVLRCGTGMRVQAQLPGGGGVCAGVHVQVGEWVRV